jgi:DNA polymerase I-like protein with 3'-5' exonuclease and polymerase domains
VGAKFKQIASRYIVPGAARGGGLRLVFDTEADGLLDDATVVHFVVANDVDSNQVDEYGEQIAAALAHLTRANHLIGHNACGFDLPLLHKLHNWTPKAGCTIVDTLIASRLILPHLGRIDDQATALGDPPLGKLRGSHKLEAWGIRLGITKTGTDITDFSTPTPELRQRCVSDTDICKAIWRFLRLDNYDSRALELEHHAAAACSRISSNGVWFDVNAAEQLGKHWSQRRDELAAALRTQFPELKKVTRPRIIALLQKQGWTPDEFTETGKPSLKNNSLENIAAAYPEFAGAAEYFALDWLLGNMLRGKSAWARQVQADGRIHAGLLHIGQPHGRASCLSPNLHGIPNPKKGAKFGVECRTLFYAPAGRVMVAADMANFQDRAFAHYLADFDGGAYLRRYLSGEDMHWSTAGTLGLIDANAARDKKNSVHTALREGAKRFRYAFLFGAQAKRLGRIVYETVRAVHNADPDLMQRFFGSSSPGEAAIKRVGERALGQFMAATPGLRKLRESIAAQVSRGWTAGLDGRRVPLLAQHTALNYLLVSAEAVVCKRWLTQVHDELGARFGSGAYITLWVHDEIVVDCRPEIAEQVGELLVRHAKEAGEHYELKVPLDAEYKIGRNWAGEPIDANTMAAAPPPITQADRDEINAGLKREGIEPINWETPPSGADAALDYSGRRGWHVFPVPPGTKKSYIKADNGGMRWGATRDPDTIRRHWGRWPEAGVGVPTGIDNNIWVLEADTMAGHGVDGLASIAALEQQHGALPETLMAESPSGSVHRYFKHPGNNLKIKCATGKLGPGLDVLGDGGMVVAPPSTRPGKGRYRWLNDLPAAAAPAWLLELVQEQPRAPSETKPEADIELVIAALDAIPNADVDWGEWNRTAMATWRATAGSDEGLAAFERWSGKSSKHDAKTTQERWQHYFSSPPTQIGAGTLFYLANGGERDDTTLSDENQNPVGENQRSSEPNTEPPKTEPPKGNGAAGAPLFNTPSDPAWPALAAESHHGLAGEVVARILPHTESDPGALLLQFLTSIGNAIGRGPYFLVEGTKHYSNLFIVLAGRTAKARKGTSADRIRQLFEAADPEWAQQCVRGGISSGEGILWAIRDPIYVMKKGELECTDPGVDDKRLLLDEREYQQALAVMTRPGNTVSRIIRDAWDGRPHIESLTKNSPAKVTDPMISIVSHITIDELRESLDRTSMANGYANRFLFACVRRGRLLPHGGNQNDDAVHYLGSKIANVLTKTRRLERVTMTPPAAERWEEIYTALSVEQPGLLGAITARAEAQTLRLALIYALTDSVGAIDVAHLNAALAVWHYCEGSAKLIFGDTVGDPLADEILRALRSCFHTGMTRSDLTLMFRHSPHRTGAIGAALNRLLQLGKVRTEQSATGGRPVDRWFALSA